MKNMKKFLFALIGLFVFSQSAFAHEFILKPSAASGEKNEIIKVQGQAAHIMMESEEMEPLQDMDLKLVSANGEEINITIKEDPATNSLLGEAALPSADPLLVVGHRKPQLWSETTQDYQAGDRKSLEAKGFKVLNVGKYEKFAKTLINSNAKDDKVYNKVLGQALEIELLTNPATVKAGGEIECKILAHGKPLATEVLATYDGFSKKEDDYAVKTESGADGIAKFTVDKPGLWMIRVGNSEKGTDAGIDTWVTRATYVFEIK